MGWCLIPFSLVTWPCLKVLLLIGSLLSVAGQTGQVNFVLINIYAIIQLEISQGMTDILSKQYPGLDSQTQAGIVLLFWSEHFGAKYNNCWH